MTEIPLANTVFQNGLRSSMVASQWERDGVSRQWVRQRSLPLFNLSINIPVPATGLGGSDAGFKSVLGVPVTPLTVPRQIVEGYGNIIREMGEIGGMTRGPASKELESSVSGYFADQGIESRPATVWALILPGKRVRMNMKRLVYSHAGYETSLDGAEDLRDARAKALNKKVGQLLANGARLHRVLSGGGGWGQKKGLLSLDPESRYATEDDENSAAFPSRDGTGPAEHREALGEVARPGDIVQFFLSPTSLSKPLPDHTMSGAGQGQTAAYDGLDSEVWAQRVVFGTIPSTIDTIPGEASTEAGNGQGRDCIVVKDQFGALSEQGLSQSTTEGVGAAVRGRAPTREQTPCSTTKVDVPFSRFVATL
ncbi:MAG: hypothetical protein M1832_003935 [Thelocarpon impressellum]|nr:MAG: hypothetical protein M1832_003935 [Thelocarpon impressellum]